MRRRPRRLPVVPEIASFALTLTLVLGLMAPAPATADAEDAKKLLKAMSDYMTSEESISFEFDAILEVVTTEDQKLGLASSGAITMNRPGKIRATRAGGFADIEMIFDGKTLTMFGSDANLYSQISVPGDLDHLVDVLRDDYDRPLPAADLILSDAYDELMTDVIDIKDLGSGVVEGVECDHLAFRKEYVDWQIWIAQGATPYPCRYSVTTKDMPLSPQYSIQLRNWKTGSAVAADDFGFKNSTEAAKVEVEDLKGMGSLPGHFHIEKGDAQ